MRLAGRAFSLIGMLITMACIIVLASLLMSSLNQATTGGGSVKGGTVRSFQDKLNLSQIGQVLFVAANDSNGRLPEPAFVIGARDGSPNTTANLFSLLVAQHSIAPKMLMSGNEYSPNVREADYDFTAYNPHSRAYWDPNFKADLKRESNTSFAHLPLFGQRFEKHWRRASYSSTFPLMGNRGPYDGRHDPQSYTYGRDGSWAGHLVFGDGHVAFVDSFTPQGVIFEQRGQVYSDNIFAIEDGESGADAIITFTLEMTPRGPVIQHD
jgi:hypothetical protein